MPDRVERVRSKLASWSARVESREEWESVRERGHEHWIPWRGVLGSGVPIVVLILGASFLTGDFLSSDGEPPWWVEPSR